MRRIKVLPLLIVAAIVGAALAAPAGASAVQWLKGGNPLTKAEPIELNSSAYHGIEFEIDLGNTIDCTVHAVGTVGPGAVGELTGIDIDGTENRCLTGGIYAHCVVTGTATQPLDMEVKSTKEVSLFKPKPKLGSGDRILWTWNFSENNEGECKLKGNSWRIKGPIPLVPVTPFGVITGVKFNTTVEYQKLAANGGIQAEGVFGVKGEWAGFAPGNYTIG
jgi:hypothetical protein